MKTLPFVCAALLASSFASAATPTSTSTSIDPSRERIVHYADLDLNDASDAKILYQRIRSAARTVCWVPGVMQVMASAQMRRCVQDTTERAVAAVDAPGLKECTSCTFVARAERAAE